MRRELLHAKDHRGHEVPPTVGHELIEHLLQLGIEVDISAQRRNVNIRVRVDQRGQKVAGGGRRRHEGSRVRAQTSPSGGSVNAPRESNRRRCQSITRDLTLLVCVSGCR